MRLYKDTPKIWDRYIFSDTCHTKIAPPRHGDSSGVRGAAWLWGREPAVAAQDNKKVVKTRKKVR